MDLLHHPEKRKKNFESNSPKSVVKHIKLSNIGSYTDLQLIPLRTSCIQQPSPVQDWSIQKVENYSFKKK